MPNFFKSPKIFEMFASSGIPICYIAQTVFKNPYSTVPQSV